jgi:hypothetical protein
VKKLLRNGRILRDEFELGPLSLWRERERVRVVSARHYAVSNLAPLTLSLSPHEAWGERGTIKDWRRSIPTLSLSPHEAWGERGTIKDWRRSIPTLSLSPHEAWGRGERSKTGPHTERMRILLLFPI